MDRVPLDDRQNRAGDVEAESKKQAFTATQRQLARD
jgi:hypothetical protein